MDFAPSPRCQTVTDKVTDFIRQRLLPYEMEWLRRQRSQDNPWSELDELAELRAQAKQAGLWNLFLPDDELGGGLTHVEYAPVAEAMGHSVLAPELFNCNAPDTGNMEVLWKYGSGGQKDRWLKPLLAGDIRSAFCMTEPGVASSDPTNLETTAQISGDEVVINGRKWWSTGIGHPRCELLIVVAVSDPDAERHRRHSLVLVPRHADGVKVHRMLPVYGDEDPPYGHGEVSFSDVRVPVDNFIGGPGEGFAIAQGRLGPGRVHHCMRLIGAAERALGLALKRGQARHAFGQPLARLDGNSSRIAEARCSIDQARLLVLKTAWLLDQGGARAAASEVSQIKLVVPRMAEQVIDFAIQIHGGAGLSDDFPLTALYSQARALRLADGPDEVHRRVIARRELKP